MKICYLGDANSIHTKKLCNFFREKGYDISVISLNDGEIDGVEVYSMSMKIESGNSSFSKIRYLKNILKVKKIIRDINPDILHAHYATSYGLIGSLINYKPYIISVWGSDVYDFPNRSIIHKFILEYNLRKADKILSTSKAMAVETNKYSNKDILVTPFGVDIEKFSPNKYKSKEEKNEFVIGTIKTLEDIYGIDILIRAFKIVKDRNNINIRLKIAGRGSKERHLKNLTKELEIDKYVDFLGYINQNQVAEEFRNFDIAIFPSFFESFGVAAVEAQACGTVVIVSDINGLMEATLPKQTSLIFEKGNYNDLADKIEFILKNDEMRNEMSLNARKYVKENYNIIDNFNNIDKVYIDLLKNIK